MSYFNMFCDGCGREVQGYNIVNGMKFCAKCYQEIFGNKNMTENLKNMYEAYLKILNEKDQRISELEEQLKNARTKYFVGYDSCFNPIVREMDLDIILPIYMHDKDFKFYDTKKEALEKLKELGEKK